MENFYRITTTTQNEHNEPTDEETRLCPLTVNAASFNCGSLPAGVHRKILGVVSVFLILLKVQLCQQLAGLHHRVVSVLQQTVRAIYLRWRRSRENRITKRPQNMFNRHATFKCLPVQHNTTSLDVSTDFEKLAAAVEQLAPLVGFYRQMETSVLSFQQPPMSWDWILKKYIFISCSDMSAVPAR